MMDIIFVISEPFLLLYQVHCLGKLTCVVYNRLPCSPDFRRFQPVREREIRLLIPIAISLWGCLRLAKFLSPKEVMGPLWKALPLSLLPGSSNHFHSTSFEPEIITIPLLLSLDITCSLGVSFNLVSPLYIMLSLNPSDHPNLSV